MTGFSDPILTGDGSLIRIAEKSVNYVAGVSGWQIDRGGGAEFNSGTFRGSIIVGTTAGKRIEINVLSGVIDMFDATNAVVAEWSAPAGRFIVYKAGTGQTGYVALDTISPDIGVIMQSNSAKYPVTGYIYSADTIGGGGIPSTVMGSGNAPSANDATIAAFGQSVDRTIATKIQLSAKSVVLDDGLLGGTSLIFVDQTSSRGAAAVGQGAQYGLKTTVHGNGGNLPASVRPQWVDEQGTTKDLSRPPGVWPPELSGFVAWTGDPIACFSTNSGTSGVINLTALWIPGPCTLTTVDMFLTVVGATLTANQCFAGLYNATGTRVGVTANMATIWASAATLGPWAAPFTAPVSIPSADWYYVAWLANGTTIPTWLTHSEVLANGVSVANIGLPAGKGRVMKTVANTNTTLPATLPALNGTNWSLATYPFWGGVS